MIDQVIASWRAEEAEVRARLKQADVAAPAQLSGKSGMEVFEAIFAGELPPPPMGETLDFLPIRITFGEAIFQGTPQPRHYNPMGTVHGGWFAALLDSAVGCAIHSTLPAGKRYTTLELKLNMVRAISAATPLIRATGKILHAGRQIATAEGSIIGPDGKMHAHATTTCMIFDC